jgi:2,4-diketo-3-deoxy-L-fuconate hydrolase
MKLVRFGEIGRERPGLIDPEGMLRSLEGIVNDIGGNILNATKLAELSAQDHTRLPEVTGTPRFGPPVAHVGKMICVGLNYADHAAESGMPVPAEPVLFMKATTAIVGPNDPVVIPFGSQKTDWEVELGVVIGEVSRRVSIDAALDSVGHGTWHCRSWPTAPTGCRTERLYPELSISNLFSTFGVQRLWRQ